MRKTSLFFCMFLWVLMVPFSVRAEQALCGYEKVTQIPLQDIGGYLLGTIQINGHSLQVITDTGSEGSLISRDGADFLRLPKDPGQKTILYGSKGEQDLVHNAIVSHMNLGGYHLKSVSIPVGDIAQYPRVNPPIVGLIGGDILSHFDLEFDVQAGRLSFWDVESHSMLCRLPPFWYGNERVTAIEQKGNRVFLVVKVDRFPVRALLDSGARSRIISEEKVKRMGIRPELLAARPGGLASTIGSKDIMYHWYQFHSFEIAGQIDDRPVLTISPLRDDADMLIGSDWFAAHKVWIAYKRKKLFFIRQEQVK